MYAHLPPSMLNHIAHVTKQLHAIVSSSSYSYIKCYWVFFTKMSESEVEETPPGSPEATFARPSRQKSLSVKLKDAQLHLDELQSDPNSKFT